MLEHCFGIAGSCCSTIVSKADVRERLSVLAPADLCALRQQVIYQGFVFVVPDSGLDMSGNCELDLLLPNSSLDMSGNCELE